MAWVSLGDAAKAILEKIETARKEAKAKQKAGA